MGLPLGWLADRMSRRLLIALGAGFWCLATAACGLAGSFAQLFVARIGVGIGEAALSPAALSLISDSFPKERRALPIGIYAGAARRGVAQAPIVVTTLGMACCGLVLAQAAWADSAAAALAWYGPGLLCLTLPGGTAIQEAVPNALRGQASAIYYLCNSLLGLSLGPLSVALLTDRFYGDPARVGDALALVAILIGPSTALLAYSTRRPFGRMIGQLRSGVAA